MRQLVEVGLKRIDISHILYDEVSGKFFNRNSLREIGSYTRRYARTFLNNKEVKLHRLAFLCKGIDIEGKEVDHINGDTSDNRWCNLRVCSRDENAKNRKVYATSTTKVKGVYLSKYKGNTYYLAAIQSDKKRHFLGSFKTLEEAQFAYEKASDELHNIFKRKLT